MTAAELLEGFMAAAYASEQFSAAYLSRFFLRNRARLLALIDGALQQYAEADGASSDSGGSQTQEPTKWILDYTEDGSAGQGTIERQGDVWRVLIQMVPGMNAMLRQEDFPGTLSVTEVPSALEQRLIASYRTNRLPSPRFTWVGLRAEGASDYVWKPEATSAIKEPEPGSPPSAEPAAPVQSAKPARAAAVPDSLRGLDPEQLAAALTDGRVLVAASAGSGKTYVLTRRIIYLIRERRVLPHRIMALAFNRRAAREISDRLALDLSQDQLQDLSIGTMHSTFGRLAAEFAAPRDRDAIRVNLIKKPALLFWFMARLWSECRNDPPPRRMANLIQSWAGENLTPAQASEQAIGDAERRGAIWYEWYLGFKGALERGRWTPPCRDTGSQRIWREFLQRFRGGGSKRLGDFTDMILLLLHVLQEPAVQRELAVRWDHILVDEAQDLNAVEHQILGLLTSAIDGSRGQSFWLVGDEKQSINYFVGARPDLFSRWAKPGSGFVVRPITTNYRCTPEIIELSNRLMANHPLMLRQESRPAPGKQRGTGEISLTRPTTHYAGAVEAMQRIRTALNQGARPADFAILARTNLELAAFETAALLLTVPYSRRNSQPFLESPEARVVMAYLMVATGEPADKQDAALAIALDRPARLFLREPDALQAVIKARVIFGERHDRRSETVDPLMLLEESDHGSMLGGLRDLRGWESWKEPEALKELELLYRAVATMREIARMAPMENSDRRTQEILNLILEVEGAPPKKGAPRTRLRDVLVPWAANDEDAAEPDGEETDAGLGNVEFFYTLANGKDRNGASLQNPVAFVYHLLELKEQSGDLSFDAAAWDQKQLQLPLKDRQPVPAVLLSTVHSVKGAQWKDVTVVMAGGVFPFPPKTPAGELSEREQEALRKRHEAEFLTERQLAYVAFTRAAERLHVQAPLQNAYGRAATVSEFITDSLLGAVPGQEEAEAAARLDEPFIASLPAGEVPLSRSAEEFLAPPEQLGEQPAPGAPPEPTDEDEETPTADPLAPPDDSKLTDDELLIRHGVTIKQTMTEPTRPGKKPRPVWTIRGGPRSLYDMLREEGAKSFRGVMSAWADPKEVIVQFLRGRSSPETPLEKMQSIATRAEERAERRETRAEKWGQVARSARHVADSIADAIPMGQPILVGHHSEKRHRAAIERMHRKMGQYFEANDKEKWLRNRAAHDRKVADLLLSGPRLTVTLAAEEPAKDAPAGFLAEEVPSLLDAGARVVEFLLEQNLRSDEWGGAVVTANGAVLAVISPNGRIWHPAAELGGEQEEFSQEELAAPMPERLLLTMRVFPHDVQVRPKRYLISPTEQEVDSLDEAVEAVKAFIAEHSLERENFPGALVKAASVPVAWIDYSGEVFTTDESGHPTSTPVDPSRWRPPSGPLGKFSTGFASSRVEEAEAEQRRFQRELARLPASDSQAVKNRRLWLQGEIERQRTKADYWRQEIKAAGGIKFDRRNVQKGDFVSYRGSWYPVVRANEKTVTLGNWLGIAKFTYPVPWAEITQALDPQKRPIVPGKERSVEGATASEGAELDQMAAKVAEAKEAPNRDPERAVEFFSRRLAVASKNGLAANLEDEIRRSIPSTMYPRGRERLMKFLRYGVYANEPNNVKQALIGTPDAEEIIDLLALLDRVPERAKSDELAEVIRQWANDIESRKATQRRAPEPESEKTIRHRGSKYDSELNIVQIAKLVRADIKQWQSEHPQYAQMDVSVTSERGSTYASLLIRIKSFPFPMFTEEARQVMVEEQRTLIDPWTPQAREAIGALEEIAKAYQRSETHSQSDLHNTNFFLDVLVAEEIRRAEQDEYRAQKERTTAREPAPAQKASDSPPSASQVAPASRGRPGSAWASLGEWLDTWRRLYQQPPSAQGRRNLQQHFQSLPEDIIVSASPDELVALEGITRLPGLPAAEGQDPGSWTARIRRLIDSARDRLSRELARGGQNNESCPPTIPGCALGVLGAECGIATDVLTKTAEGDLDHRPARYCLTDVRALIPSHVTPSAVRRAEQQEPYAPPSPVANFSNRRDYPAQVQERRYDRVQEELKVTRNAQRFVPAEVWNPVPNPTTGPPIVTAQGWVLGGNGRTMILDEYYNSVSDPAEKAERIRVAKEYLKRSAGFFGLRPEEIDRVDEPTVVRVVDTLAGRRGAKATDLTEEERAELVRLVRDYNVSLQQSMDPNSRATSAARVLPVEALDYLAQNLADKSLAEFLASRDSEPFVRLLGRSVLDTDDPELYDQGRLTDHGKERIERLLTARLIPDPDFVEKLGLGLRRSVAQMAPYLLAAAAANQDFDLSTSLNLALRELMAFQHSGYDRLDEYLRQPALLAQDRETLAALKRAKHGEELLQILSIHANSYRKLSTFAREYARHAIAQNSNQGTLFASEKLPEPEAFAKAVKDLEKGK
jgi:superfamily I DNA/RNA helicase